MDICFTSRCCCILGAIKGTLQTSGVVAGTHHKSFIAALHSQTQTSCNGIVIAKRRNLFNIHALLSYLEGYVT